ncbi:DUF397 domain-containing protein [Streptomyces sp. NPDC048275]|uniref:DUF397 domain-containing protein n=1 Tax=Streptomyces sp. NPDC048275 TaxID=3155629 RepID=UPI0033C88C78
MHIRAAVPPNVMWFKSSYSDAQGGACVEGARLLDGIMAVRDSKIPAGPVFLFQDEAWAAFTTGVKAGAFAQPRF